MLIILCLYALLVWLLFSKLKLVKWGWGSGTVTVLIGAFILAVFLAMFNYLTPSGSFVVGSRVAEITPNVSGQVTAIPVKPNVPVKKRTVLFEIDPAPFQYKVDQLQASLAAAQQQVKQLQANYQQASANVDGLVKQLAFHTQRLADYEKLIGQGAQTEFRLQDTQVQYETVQYQLQAAKAAQLNAQLAMDSEIGGVNTTVAQIQAQRSVMSFIVTDEIVIVGMFSPNGFQTIKPGAAVKLVFDNDPGRIHYAKILAISEGVGEGQIAVSGMLTKVTSIGGAKTYPAVISIPSDVDRQQLRLGMPGTAWVFADNAGVIGLIMSILVWISSYTAYL
jgi:multidrug resistance efflux pump